MLQPEPRLEILVGQLKMLPAGDRAAILARLSAGERREIHAQLRGAAAPDRPASPFSPDIAERVAKRDDRAAPLTAAGKAALGRALATAGQSGAPERPAGSLFDAFGALLRRGTA